MNSEYRYIPTMKVIFLVSTLWVAGSFSGYGQRAAFFIGIKDYKNMDTLPNCPRDADSMKEVLYTLGFDTYEIKNASNSEVRAAFDKWFPLMSKYRDVLIYFSGHGLMVASTNEFMALNDFNPKSYKQVENRTVHTYYLLKKFAELNVTRTSYPLNKLIIIDACREFPTKDKIIDAIKKDQLELRAPKYKNLRNYAIYYTTEAGGVSFGDGPLNSVATKALLKQLDTRPLSDVRDSH